jgi:hypothetical protein
MTNTGETTPAGAVNWIQSEKNKNYTAIVKYQGRFFELTTSASNKKTRQKLYEALIKSNLMQSASPLEEEYRIGFKKTRFFSRERKVTSITSSQTSPGKKKIENILLRELIPSSPAVDLEMAYAEAEKVLKESKNTPIVDISAKMKHAQRELEKASEALQKQAPSLHKQEYPRFSSLIQALQEKQKILSRQIEIGQNFIEEKVEAFLYPYLTGKITAQTVNLHRPSLPSQILPMLEKEFSPPIFSKGQAVCYILSCYLKQCAQACLPPIAGFQTRFEMQTNLKKSILPGLTESLKRSLKIDFKELNLSNKELEFLAAWGLRHTSAFNERAPLPENWRDTL